MMRTVGPTLHADRFAQLEAFVSGQRITDDVVRDVLAEGLDIADVVQMDEFTIDLVVAVGPSEWLVYDTT
mgnify:CR=1 FL=1